MSPWPNNFSPLVFFFSDFLCQDKKERKSKVAKSRGGCILSPLDQIEVICVSSQRNQSFLWLWEGKLNTSAAAPEAWRRDRERRSEGKPVSDPPNQSCHPLSLSSTHSISLSDGITRAFNRSWLELDATNLPQNGAVLIHLVIFLTL